MRIRYAKLLALRATVLVFAAATAPSAHAQFAVIDVASIAQLVQQLAQLRAQLLQAQTLYQSMTGSRGMQLLLSTANPNYLPTSWNSLQQAGLGHGSYTSLAAGVNGAVTQNALLSASQLALLSPQLQSLISTNRQNIALEEAINQQSLANASDRFADVQRLSGAIGSTGDQKSVLELQATLSAEQGLLLGEQTKLQVVDRAIQSQVLSSQQQERELVIASHGSFDNRFEPVLP